MTGIESLTQQALADIASAQTPDAIEALRVSLLGKNGSVTAQLKQLGDLKAAGVLSDDEFQAAKAKLLAG